MQRILILRCILFALWKFILYIQCTYMFFMQCIRFHVQNNKCVLIFLTSTPLDYEFLCSPHHLLIVVAYIHYWYVLNNDISVVLSWHSIDINLKRDQGVGWKSKLFVNELQEFVRDTSLLDFLPLIGCLIGLALKKQFEKSCLHFFKWTSPDVQILVIVWCLFFFKKGKQLWYFTS